MRDHLMDQLKSCINSKVCYLHALHPLFNLPHHKHFPTHKLLHLPLHLLSLALRLSAKLMCLSLCFASQLARLSLGLSGVHAHCLFDFLCCFLCKGLLASTSYRVKRIRIWRGNSTYHQPRYLQQRHLTPSCLPSSRRLLPSQLGLCSSVRR